MRLCPQDIDIEEFRVPSAMLVVALLRLLTGFKPRRCGTFHGPSSRTAQTMWYNLFLGEPDMSSIALATATWLRQFIQHMRDQTVERGGRLF
ncbi:MAG: hypothetical protein EA377_00615 [Phycisphaerales bacterium]|nr:MAG: hypothetical protein EA377_00615 [Phycisphaerales bacterium]